MMYRAAMIVKIKSFSFYGGHKGDLIAAIVNPYDNCVTCTVKLKPESVPLHIGTVPWEDFFKWFEIVAFTNYYRKGTWPYGWCENEGTIYWR